MVDKEAGQDVPAPVYPTAAGVEKNALGAILADGVNVASHAHATGAKGDGTRLAVADRTERIVFRREADTGAADVMSETAMGRLPAAPVTVLGAYFIPDAAATHHATNYATITVAQRKEDGSTATDFGSLDTATGDLAAFAASAFTMVVPIIGPLTGNQSGTVTLAITKAAAGVIVPGGVVVLEYSRD